MWSSEAIFNCWGDKIGALAEIASGDTVLLRTDASWQSGAAADPAVGHLLR